MPKVLAFHPVVGVRGRDGVISLIRCTLEDFVDSSDLLRDLGRIFRVNTMGDLLESVRDYVYGVARMSSLDVDEGFDGEGDFVLVLSKLLEDIGCSRLEIECLASPSSARGEMCWDLVNRCYRPVERGYRVFDFDDVIK